MNLGLENKRALITGGSAGIGFAIASALVQEGAKVTVASRNSANLSAAVEQLRKLSPTGQGDFVEMDLLDETSLRKGVEKALTLGPVDILVINTGGPAAGKILDLELSSWDKGYQSLVRAVVLLCQLLVPGMQKRNWGRVLTITSTSAKELIPMLPISGTFRAGLSGLVKQLAKEVGQQGVLINNLLPGPTRTARLDELKLKNPALLETFVRESAVGRLAEPEEIANAAAFLLSAANSYITGTDILVDGGFTKAL